MRSILVLGGANAALAVRLAAELAAKNVQVYIAEGQETAMAAADTLASGDRSLMEEHDANEDGDVRTVQRSKDADVIVLGSGCGLGNLALEKVMALELQRFEVAEPKFEDFYIEPKKEAGRYWQQTNHAFDRKQQGMRAKARRR